LFAKSGAGTLTPQLVYRCAVLIKEVAQLSSRMCHLNYTTVGHLFTQSGVSAEFTFFLPYTQLRVCFRSARVCSENIPRFHQTFSVLIVFCVQRKRADLSLL
jgi:hypothetical protein